MSSASENRSSSSKRSPTIKLPPPLTPKSIISTPPKSIRIKCGNKLSRSKVTSNGSTSSKLSTASSNSSNSSKSISISCSSNNSHNNPICSSICLPVDQNLIYQHLQLKGTKMAPLVEPTTKELLKSLEKSLTIVNMKSNQSPTKILMKKPTKSPSGTPSDEQKKQLSLVATSGSNENFSKKFTSYEEDDTRASEDDQLSSSSISEGSGSGSEIEYSTIVRKNSSNKNIKSANKMPSSVPSLLNAKPSRFKLIADSDELLSTRILPSCVKVTPMSAEDIRRRQKDNRFNFEKFDIDSFLCKQQLAPLREMSQETTNKQLHSLPQVNLCAIEKTLPCCQSNSNSGNSNNNLIINNPANARHSPTDSLSKSLKLTPSLKIRVKQAKQKYSMENICTDCRKVVDVYLRDSQLTSINSVKSSSSNKAQRVTSPSQQSNLPRSSLLPNLSRPFSRPGLVNSLSNIKQKIQDNYFNLINQLQPTIQKLKCRYPWLQSFLNQIRSYWNSCVDLPLIQQLFVWFGLGSLVVLVLQKIYSKMYGNLETTTSVTISKPNPLQSSASSVSSSSHHHNHHHSYNHLHHPNPPHH